VQEAAHEDANIIFGAVVDPELKGKVKITVIATGFTAQASAPAVTPGTVADTPVDMTLYADQSRARAEIAAASPVTTALGDRLGVQRFSIARRPTVDLAPTASVAAGQLLDRSALDADPGIEATSTFDVPAFLRRQES
jgi:cell division protein FtsZ